ncbi:ribosomal RNA large subunit methyltransferase I-like [Planococcus citri]|uniref:RNA methyltransferase n=1 Tax=Planococcus citri TaxID=170843 RepID=S5NFY3_9HEMI|nr:RNA methyltransferase [Planococcus citri]
MFPKLGLIVAFLHVIVNADKSGIPNDSQSPVANEVEDERLNGSIPKTPRLYLACDREKSLLRRHPWIYSGAVDRVEGRVRSGATIDIYDDKGNWLARASWSPLSQIRARVWSFIEDEQIDVNFFLHRLKVAQRLRTSLATRDSLDSYRLISGESDGLPGIVIDRYGDFLVLQLLSSGAEYHRENLLKALKRCYPKCSIYERSDVAVRKKEGLRKTQGVISGDQPPHLLHIREHDMSFLVDIVQGHKTGFYLDQRDGRIAARKYAIGRRVLDCFSYTGGFSVSVMKGGCREVINVDTSQQVLDIAKQNLALNRLDMSRARFVRDDVFQLLRRYREEGETFGMIILDPPKFAENRNQLASACRGYKDINMLAMQLLEPEGILMTFSCSGLMTTDLFQKIIADAALDAKREIQFIEQFRQAADHPVAGAHPEGLYLKGFACRVE